MGGKEKFPLYLSPEKKAILERRYQEDGSRSILPQPSAPMEMVFPRR